MNKAIFTIIVMSCSLVACEKEEQKSRQLGNQASEQVKQMETKINQAAQKNIEQYNKIDELSQ